MHNRAQHIRKLPGVKDASEEAFRNPENGFSVTEIRADEIEILADDWLADCQIRQRSERTIQLRRGLIGRLQWYLAHRNAIVCGRSELRGFFAYLSTSHTEQEGRWGHGSLHHARRAMHPTTVRTYYAHLGSFFNWLVDEEIIPASPLRSIVPPKIPRDQIQPFSPEQVEELLRATSITHQIVELHGGTIRVHSAGEGQGATFVVELPLATAHPPADRNPKAP